MEGRVNMNTCMCTLLNVRGAVRGDEREKLKRNHLAGKTQQTQGIYTFHYATLTTHTHTYTHTHAQLLILHNLTITVTELQLTEMQSHEAVISY